MNHVKFLIALILTNFRSSISQRGSFITQILFMALNNLIFFSVWWIIFSRIDDINGWQLSHTALMFGFSATSYGIFVLFAAGARKLSRMISSGDLDPYLVQPKNVIVQSICSRSDASGWGDIASGIFLFWYSGYLTLQNIPYFLIFSICTSIVTVSFAVVLGSLSFWLGSLDRLSDQIFEFFLLLSVYPQDIYSFGFKVVLFTVIPAAFVGYLPVRFFMDFSIGWILILMAGAILFPLITLVIFSKGLRRYESGNRFGIGPS